MKCLRLIIPQSLSQALLQVRADMVTAAEENVKVRRVNGRWQPGIACQL